MGIKGTVRRNQDGDFIHANVDLDIIITEEVVCMNALHTHKHTHMHTINNIILRINCLFTGRVWIC